MIAIDDILGVSSITIWAMVLWRGLVARHLSLLWWSTLLLGLLITSRLPKPADLLAHLLGEPLVRLLTEVIVIGAAALITQWQLARIHPTGNRRLTRCAFGAASAGVLLSAAAPSQLLPNSRGSGPTIGSAATDPSLTLPSLASTAALATLFVIGAAREAGNLPPGRLHTATRALICSALCLIGWTVTQAAAIVVASVAGPSAAAEIPTGDEVLVVGLVAFLLGIGLPLLGRTRHHEQVGRVDTDLARLWRALLRPADEQDAPDRFSMLIEIRDQMWELQQRVPEQDLRALARLTHQLGLTGTRANAFVAAACLHIAQKDDGEAIRATGMSGGSDLSRLGGGRSVPQEAAWLAQLAAAYCDELTSTAASWVIDQQVLSAPRRRRRWTTRATP